MRLNFVNIAFLLLSSRAAQGLRVNKNSEDIVNEFDDLIHRLELEKLDEGSKYVSEDARNELKAFIITHFDRSYRDKEYSYELEKLKDIIDDERLDLTKVSNRELLIDKATSLEKLSQILTPVEESHGRSNSHMKDFATIYFGLCSEQDKFDSDSGIEFHKYAADTLYDFILVHYLKSSRSDSNIDSGIKNFANTLYELDNVDFCVDETQKTLGNLFEDMDPKSD
ncbi:hypothetical protein CONCODRAFT_67766 [Conidiobolus coronatus NRRL 28638]|uniref:Uncharacterized protein n=1 Tax=Conidiobolus coronatus (strain ATCC 28846 / CBS 209.66 / NRRL 28638) TaxID=796925 RepID=A0A137PGP5_CONC2|nr:hypothetical protein CONCODRAFT_67766 [Conidiobolus coronatus NRRL 28638]|eukprot:KXN74173.1 hypothetical protein CONCODRAFT_67766 [Conidiobolus coronatus NRRL 28638]